MELLKATDITLELLNSGPSGVPIIMCVDTLRLHRKFSEAGYKAVFLNRELSKALLALPQEDRISRVETVLSKLTKWDGHILLRDFEMLFDPRYMIDAVKFICEKSRTASIAVIWPGKYENGMLSYASPSDADYHVFNCDSYQLRVVI